MVSLDPKKDESGAKDELLITKGVPLVAWKEKIGILRSNLNDEQIDLVVTLDIIN